MEEFWKDINITPMKTQNYPNPTTATAATTTTTTTTTCTHTSFQNKILQDFLKRPFGNDPPNSLISNSSRNSISGTNSPLHSNPITSLRLNSGNQQFPFVVDHVHSSASLSSVSDHLQTNHTVSNVPSFRTENPFEGLASSSGLTKFGKRNKEESECNTCGQERRHKRMIKNREAASRSRARKQVCSFSKLISLFHPLFLTLLSFKIIEL